MPIFTLRPVSCVALRNNGGSGSVHSFPYFLFRKLSGVKTAGICHKGFLDFTNVERRPPFTIMKGSNYNQPIKIWSLQKWGNLAFNNPSFRVNSTFLEAPKNISKPSRPEAKALKHHIQVPRFHSLTVLWIFSVFSLAFPSTKNPQL